MFYSIPGHRVRYVAFWEDRCALINAFFFRCHELANIVFKSYAVKAVGFSLAFFWLVTGRVILNVPLMILFTYSAIEMIIYTLVKLFYNW